MCGRPAPAKGAKCDASTAQRRGRRRRLSRHRRRGWGGPRWGRRRQRGPGQRGQQSQPWCRLPWRKQFRPWQRWCTPCRLSFFLTACKRRQDHVRTPHTPSGTPEMGTQSQAEHQGWQPDGPPGARLHHPHPAAGADAGAAGGRHPSTPCRAGQRLLLVARCLASWRRGPSRWGAGEAATANAGSTRPAGPTSI